MRHLILCAVLAATKWFSLAPAEDKAPDPPAPPTPKGCQCGCGKMDCKCGKSAGAVGCARIDVTKLTEAMDYKPSVHLSVPTQEVWLFSPSWCAACKSAKIRLGTGDQRTRLIVKEQEAHFTPKSYPCFYDPVGLKQWSGQPKDMDEVRRMLGMATPSAKEPALGAMSVGEIPKDEFDLLKKLLLGKAGPLNLPNEEIQYELGNGLVLVIPELAKGICTVTGGQRRTEFTTMPFVKYAPLRLSQQCKAITIDGDVLTLELPWAPDVSMTREK